MTSPIANTSPGAPTADVSLAAEPFTALAYNFGMLLGVDDFEVEQGYHRGKHRLHGAWLHGAGVVWGFDVVTSKAGEIKVGPGLALDAAGRELHVDDFQCARLLDWYDAHKGDPDFRANVDERKKGAPSSAPSSSATAVTFDLHLVARFVARTARNVPVVAGANGAADAAPSRVEEAAVLVLRPGLAPANVEASHHAYPRVRHLFRPLDARQTDAKYKEVERWLETIRKAPPHARRSLYTKAFRELAYFDQQENSLKPGAQHDGEASAEDASSIFPAGDDTEILLAEIRGVVVDQGKLIDAGQLDVTDRRPHVSSACVEELLCDLLAAISPPRDAGGPRVKKVHARGKKIILELTQRVLPVGPSAFAVTEWREGHWHTINVTHVVPAVEDDFRVDVDVYEVEEEIEIERGHFEVELEIEKEHVVIDVEEDDWSKVTLELEKAATGRFVRVVVFGTGPHPVVNRDGVALAGGVHDGPAGRINGRDFVAQARRRAHDDDRSPADKDRKERK